MHAPVVATLNGSTVLTVPGFGPELCHDRGPSFPHPTDRRGPDLPHPRARDCHGASVTVAHGVASVIVSG